MRNFIVGIPENGGSEAGQLEDLASATTVSSAPPTGFTRIFSQDRELGHVGSDGLARRETFVASGSGAFVQAGTVSFAAGVVSVNATFPEAYRAGTTPAVTIGQEKSGSIQGLSFYNLTNAGFTIQRTAAAGTLTAHYHAIGHKQ